MRAANPPPNDAERVTAVSEHAPAAALHGASLDGLVRIAAQQIGAKMAFISVVDAGRWCMVSRHGIELESSDREVSFCVHVVEQAAELVVPDAAADPRFAGDPLVTSAPFVRLFAGVPLFGEGGVVLGAFAVADPSPRQLDDGDARLLRSLADVARDQLALLRRLAIEQRVADSVPAMLAYWDADEHCRFANAACERWFGLPREALVGKTLRELIGPSYPVNLHHIHGALRGEPQFFEAAVRDPGGGPPRRSETRYVPHVIDGVVRGFTGLTLDVETRKRAEDRFKAVVEATPMAMLVIDRAGLVTLANAGANELLGYRPGELLGVSVGRLVPDIVEERHAALVTAYFESPADQRSRPRREVSARRKDGALVPVEVALTPIEMPEGTSALASIVDVSERRRSSALQERLAAIVESSDDAIFSVTVDGVVTSWNGGAERMFGWAAAEMMGRDALDVMMPDARAEETRSRRESGQARRLAALVRPESFESRVTRKDGTALVLWATISPVQVAAGKVTDLSVCARDVTAQKAREAELERSNAELEQFAYVASHDLQEPLRMVANYTELLAQRYAGRLDEQADKYIAYAVDGAQRMRRLIVDLLAYSRVGRRRAPPTPTSSLEVLTRVLEDLGPRIRDAGATIDLGVMPPVLADEVQLGQVFLNLVSNALKFKGERPPVVELRAKREGALVVFSVRDNGTGFEIEHASRLFQMFQRLHARGEYEGSGIGLAVAKRIVDGHGGRIWVASTPGVGSTFFFSMPAVPLERARPE